MVTFRNDAMTELIFDLNCEAVFDIKSYNFVLRTRHLCNGASIHSEAIKLKNELKIATGYFKNSAQIGQKPLEISNFSSQM
jgi:hypothetical protein